MYRLSLIFNYMMVVICVCVCTKWMIQHFIIYVHWEILTHRPGSQIAKLDCSRVSLVLPWYKFYLCQCHVFCASPQNVSLIFTHRPMAAPIDISVPGCLEHLRDPESCISSERYTVALERSRPRGCLSRVQGHCAVLCSIHIAQIEAHL